MLPRHLLDISISLVYWSTVPNYPTVRRVYNISLIDIVIILVVRYVYTIPLASAFIVFDFISLLGKVDV